MTTSSSPRFGRTCIHAVGIYSQSNVKFGKSKFCSSERKSSEISQGSPGAKCSASYGDTALALAPIRLDGSANTAMATILEKKNRPGKAS